jgi:hypothetical protein
MRGASVPVNACPLFAAANVVMVMVKATGPPAAEPPMSCARLPWVAALVKPVRFDPNPPRHETKRHLAVAFSWWRRRLSRPASMLVLHRSSADVASTVATAGVTALQSAISPCSFLAAQSVSAFIWVPSNAPARKRVHVQIKSTRGYRRLKVGRCIHGARSQAFDRSSVTR